MVDEIAFQIEVQKANVKPRNCKRKRISELPPGGLVNNEFQYLKKTVMTPLIEKELSQEIS